MYLVGFCGVLMWIVNNYVVESGMVKKQKVLLIGDDVCEGFICILLVKVFEFKFFFQIKDKLVFFEVWLIVESVINEQFGQWFEEYLLDVKIVVLKIVEVVMVCEVVRKVCEFICCKGVFDIVNLLGKFVDC